MRALAIATMVTLIGRAAPAGASEGLFLTWNDCAQAGSAAHDLMRACDTELGEQSLYCAFRLPYPLDSVVAVEIVLDVQLASPLLPGWWQFGPDSCHDGGLSVSASFAAASPCSDFWLGQATSGGPPGYFVSEPRGGPNQARMKITFALLPERYRRLDDTHLYYAARVTLRNAGTALCPGCGVPACLVLNSILIGRLPGAPGGDVLLETPGPDLANRVTWQGGGADCNAVPARPRTWGALKSRYR